MGLKGAVLGVCLSALALAPAPAAAEGRFSTWVFGDYYYFAQDHDTTAVDQSGFWFRLVDLTWDEKMDESFSTRLRVETASPGSFSGTPATMIVYMKDAWMKWSAGRQAVIFGLAMPPSHTYTEEIWGYRYIEKFPFELAGFGGSRDIGVGATGWLLSDSQLGYHVMVANGNGLLNEQDAEKRISGSLRYRFTKAFSLEAYGDFEPRSNNTDRTTFRGFAGYKSESFRAAVEYDQQTRNLTDGGSYDLRVASAFVAGQVAEKVWLVGRVDRHLDADPSYAPSTAPGRPYLPYDSSVKNTFLLAGVELRARENVAFTPNVEVILYDEPDGGASAPEDDVVARLTFMFMY
jgi:hypothetical protein